MKKIFLLLVLCLGILGGGCSTKSSYHQTGETKITQQATFAIGEIKDNTGFSPDPKEPIDLAQAMQDALVDAFKSEGIYKQDGYIIHTTLTEYSPGNAFARWVMPGAGATKLKTTSTVVDAQGQAIATIPVERTIAAGGGFTIGAWKYVFKEVAEEAVAVLKKEMGK